MAGMLARTGNRDLKFSNTSTYQIVNRKWTVDRVSVSGPGPEALFSPK